MSRHRGTSNIAFIDILLNSLIGFIVLFILALILINPKAEKKAIELDGEYLISVKWAPELADDVDTYVMDPAGNIVFFKRREDGLMHLDRDDLGVLSDVTHDAEGNRVVVIKNEELVTIRGIITGEYIVNVHMYNKRSDDFIEVTVTLTKLKNGVREIVENTVVLYRNGDERTAFRFTLDINGDVTNINYLERKIAMAAQEEAVEEESE